jgi:hypothetical protein
MPKSIDPEPAENEIECARCSAHIYYELTRCPNCGVSLYEPEDETEDAQPRSTPSRGILTGLRDSFHRLFRKPYSADEIFGSALNQAALYDDLLRKVGGDRMAADRLVEFEHRRTPGGSRLAWIRRAIERWEKDNRSSSQSS